MLPMSNLPDNPTQNTPTSNPSPTNSSLNLPSPTVVGSPLLINSFRGSTNRPRRSHREAVSISHQVVLEGAGVDASALATIVRDQTNEQYADYVNQQFLEALANNASNTNNNTSIASESGMQSNGSVSASSSTALQQSIDLFPDTNSSGSFVSLSTPSAAASSTTNLSSQQKWRGLLEEKDSTELPPNLFLFAFPDGEKKLVKFEPQSNLV
jgi:hypothetical protein